MERTFAIAAGRRSGVFDVRRIGLALTIVALASPVQAQDDRQFPFPDPYLATVTGTALNGDGLTPGIKRQIVRVSILADRNTLPGLEGRGALNVALYRQKSRAPLMFIVPGTGSSPFFGLATYLAKLFYQQGAHVVILPSPMSWNFALAASRSGVPGYTPADARDLYDAMQRVLVVLRDRYDLKVTRINLVGLSLGALEGAYVSCIDADEDRIGIARYLLVNPPLDMSSALKKLDQWDARQEKFGPEKSRELQSRAMGIMEDFARQRRDDPAAFRDLARRLAALSQEELQFLIAAYLQSALPELVTITQAIHDQGVLGEARDRLRKRLQEARHMTFTDYGDRIAGPTWRALAREPDTSMAAFAARGSFGAILDQLKGNPRVFIVHNTDDFLTDRPSIENLKTVLGPQVKLYPYGGHMGSLWFPPNRDYVLGLFRE